MKQIVASTMVVLRGDYEGGLDNTKRKRAGANGSSIGRAIAATQGDWITSDYLPSKKGELKRTGLAVGRIHHPGGASHGRLRRQPNLLHNLRPREKKKIEVSRHNTCLHL